MTTATTSTSLTRAERLLLTVHPVLSSASLEPLGWRAAAASY
jgi:hypothetical protein